MKYLLSVYTLALIALGANAYMEFFGAMFDECIAIEGATNDDIIELQLDLLPITPKGSCFRACILESAGMMLPDRTLSNTTMKYNLAMMFNETSDLYKNLANAVDICVNSVNSSMVRCGVAEHFFKCLDNNVAEVGLPNSDTRLLRACGKKIGANNTDLTNALSFQEPVSNKTACMYACVMKIKKQMDSNNKVQLEAIKAEYESMKESDPEYYQTFSNIADTCVNNLDSSKNECAIAKDLFQCLIKAQQVNIHALKK